MSYTSIYNIVSFLCSEGFIKLPSKPFSEKDYIFMLTDKVISSSPVKTNLIEKEECLIHILKEVKRLLDIVDN